MTSPNVERISDTPSWDGSNGLVAIIVRNQRIDNGVNFLTPVELPQQVALMRHPKGYRVPAHFHPKRTREVNQTQEVLIIKSGEVWVTLYLIDGMKVERVLRAGDVAILIQGGHSLEMLEDTEIIEVKQGPYVGKEIDKTNLTNT